MVTGRALGRRRRGEMHEKGDLADIAAMREASVALRE